MTSSPLTAALEYYAAQLVDLETAADKASIDQVVDLLIARDRVEAILASSSDYGAADIQKLLDLDGRLKAQGEGIAQQLNLSSCRASIKPPTDAWWWFFTPPPDPRDHYDWLWKALCIPVMTASGALLLDVSGRFLASGVDTFGAFTVVSQSILTLLTAKGTFTKSGQEGIEHALSSVNVPKHFVQEAKLALTLALLLGLFGLRSSLPQIANAYVQRGIKAQHDKRLMLAQNHYQHALQLDPSNIEAHYYLGTLQEDLQNLNEAQSAYQIAAKSDFEPAINNLARLHLLKDQPEKAVSLLTLHVNHVKNPEVKYYMRKNLGWARLQQKRYAEASTELQDAIAIDHSRADAHCLLAQVLDGQRNQTAAEAEWQDCLAYANSLIPEQDHWINLAHQRLTPQSAQGDQ